MQQLPIKFERDLRSLKVFLEKASARLLDLVITDNSSRMVSVKGALRAISLRLHRIFLSAPDEVLSELASFLSLRTKKTPAITRFIRERRADIDAKPRRVRVRTKGKSHDLKEVFDRVNNEYFDASVAASITWSRRQPGRVRRRTLGSYSFSSKTIRINPILDSPAVPPIFLEFIVYHEMLHAILGVERKSGRSIIHSRDFRKKEKEFRGFEAATKWEKANRHLL
ncbi:MAG: hypothetical protein A2054_01835 [Deltaproteobacteria bacterium GWA2_55_10]|nr:MAG: hypothetical protein A2054_01835 [Deltaproteobacteria bacterium GWA2_55_10]